MGGFKRVRKWVAVQREGSQEVFSSPLFLKRVNSTKTPRKTAPGKRQNNRGIPYLVLGAAGRLQKVALTAVHVQGSHFLLFRWLFWGYGDTARERKLKTNSCTTNSHLEKAEISRQTAWNLNESGGSFCFRVAWATVYSNVYFVKVRLAS